MISLLHLSKLIQFIFFFTILIFNSAFAATAIDIWERNENQKEQTGSEEEIKIKTPILSDELDETSIKTEETVEEKPKVKKKKPKATKKKPKKK